MIFHRAHERLLQEVAEVLAMLQARQNRPILVGVSARNLGVAIDKWFSRWRIAAACHVHLVSVASSMESGLLNRLLAEGKIRTYDSASLELEFWSLVVTSLHEPQDPGRLFDEAYTRLRVQTSEILLALEERQAFSWPPVDACPIDW